MKLKAWFYEIRPQFLFLDPIVVSLGTVLAVYDGFFNLFYMVLSLTGVICLHISVNVLNDYFDYKSGIDLHTRRTPFSGGSGVLPQGILDVQSVYRLGIASLIPPFGIAFYFTAVYGWSFIPLVLVAAISVIFYTTHLSRWMVGELFAGLNLGSLVVLGTYFTQTGFYGIKAIAACISPGILVFNLLLLNEFPDVEADLKGSRRNIPIVFGRKTASRIYCVLVVANYVSIIIPTLGRVLPITSLLACLTIPFAVKAVSLTSKHYNDARKLLPALKYNVLMVLLTPVMMSIGIFIASGML
jgi:1,4-dihydroxy-2-naphthoate octaprenyltransferase